MHSEEAALIDLPQPASVDVGVAPVDIARAVAGGTRLTPGPVGSAPCRPAA